MGSWHVNWADDVDLIVLERYVAFVDVYNVVCVVYPESETDVREITAQCNAQTTEIYLKPYFDKKL